MVAAGAPISIGISVATTGDQAGIGRDIADAADLAVQDYGGTIHGRALKTSVIDDGCTDAEKAVDAARKFIAADVAGVLGPMCTTGAQAANSLYERAGIVHISPSATRVDLSAQGEQYFFRVSWRDDVQADTQSAYARGTLAVTNVMLVDDSEPYGRGLADEFATAFEGAGGQISSRQRIERGKTDFSALARAAKSASVDAVVFEGLNPEGALIVKALKAEQFAGAFIGPDGLLSVRDFLGEGGSAVEGAIITGGPAPDDAFVAKFRAKTQRVPTTPFVLQSYDSVTALIKAIDLVATDGPGGSLVIDRAKLAAALRAMRFTGLTGAIHFDGRGDRATGTASDAGLVIYKVTAGAFVPVTP